MDFFEHQEVARKKTHLLVFYFILAILGIIAAVYALVVGIFFFLEPEEGGQLILWDPPVFFFVAAGTATVVFLASTFKTLQLSGGGEVVARELGGREVDINTTDFHERRLLNLVEEMAIASGVPVPTVFVMGSEDSINAFAAGRTPSDAVVGVTRGCMTLLSRDELQGVIAHEFSHILNGDMRLNMRLMGLLFGILFLALIGEIILRSAFRGNISSSRKEGAGAALVMLAAGAGLLVIGYVGSFFAGLIKASVSRQREFLADASAVQFTRNPDGIAGALLKIGGLHSGSLVNHPMARDASHLFFGSALSASAFATHPPLPQRIARLLPHWNGEFRETSLRPISEKSESAPSRQRQGGGRVAPPALPGMLFLDGGAGVLPLRPNEAFESLSSLHPEQIELGQEMHANLPDQWLEACRSLAGAQSMIFSLLLAQNEELRHAELKSLRQETDEATFELVIQLFGEVNAVHSAVKIGLIDLALPALRHLSPAEYARFKAIIRHLIESDGRVDLFEFMLQQVITRHLDTYFEKRGPERIRFTRLAPLRDKAGILLSTLAAMSHPEDERAIQTAFSLAAQHLSEKYAVAIPFKSGDQCGLDRIRDALDDFACASPIVKKRLLEACSLSVMADEGVSSREAELIRAVADAIGCPIPPFVRTAKLV
jgi:Zn-dependent protease with chaperone function